MTPASSAEALASAIIADIAALDAESFRNILSDEIDRKVGRDDGENMLIVPYPETLKTAQGTDELEFVISGILKPDGAEEIDVDVHGCVGTYHDDIVVSYRGVVSKGAGMALRFAT